MTRHEENFERHLQAGLAAEPASDQLYRRIAQIPLDHPRAARVGLWQRLFGQLSAETASWAGGLAAAAASLAIGFWLGFAGVGPGDEPADDSLVAMAFGDVSADIGDEL